MKRLLMWSGFSQGQKMVWEYGEYLDSLATGLRAICEEIMLYYALIFLIIGFIAAALGAGGAAAVATHISWVLFLIAIIFLLVHLLTGRRPPVN
jgi:uncharacterized membrane protein YtjA (UPF0391 family)